MGLAEKIEEIKRKPEHIRLRYIWFFVAVSMFFVVSLWIFSFKAQNSYKAEDASQIVNLDSFGSEIEQQKNLLQQTNENIQDNSNKINTEIQKNSIPDGTEENNMKKDIEKSPEKNIKMNSFPSE
jgi:hypothetical protein